MLWAKITKECTCGDHIIIGNPPTGEKNGPPKNFPNAEAVMFAKNLNKNREKLREFILEISSALGFQQLIYNVDINFSCTKDVAPSPNEGSITLHGLDDAMTDLVEDFSKLIYSDEKKERTVPYAFRFFDEKEREKIPKLPGAPESEGEVVKDSFRNKFISYSTLEVFWSNDLIFKGDITDVEKEMRSISIKAATDYYFFKSPVLQRLYENAGSETSLQVLRKNAVNMDFTKSGFVYNRMAYANLAKMYIKNYITRPVLSIGLDYYESLVKEEESNSLLKEQFDKMKSSGDTSLSIGDAVVVEDKKIKDSRGKPVNADVIILNDNVQRVLTDLSRKGLFLCYSIDDIFYIWPFATTRNFKPEVISAMEGVWSGFEDVHAVKDFFIDSDRASFESFFLSYQPGIGVVVNGTEMMIDSVSLDSDGYQITSTCSGDINTDSKKQFLWLNELKYTVKEAE